MIERGLNVEQGHLISPGSVGVRSELQLKLGHKGVVITMRTGRTKSNILRALMRREMNFRSSDDRSLLLSYAEETTVMSCQQVKTCNLLGTPKSTFLICFSPDRTKMASSHGDHCVRIVDCKTGECSSMLKGHPRTPWCLTFHPSSNQLLASGCLGGQVRVWNLKTGDSEVYTPPDKAVIASLAFHPTDQVLLIATSNKLYFWSWDQPEPFACVQTASSEEKVRLVSFSPLGDHILTAVTNIAPQTGDTGTFSQSHSSTVNRLLQSVGNSRAGADQVAAYMLRSNGTAPSSATTNTNTAPDRSGADSNSSSIPDTSSSVPSEPRENLNALSSSRQRGIFLSSLSREITDSAESEGEDYRGVMSIFRSRDDNTLNFHVRSGESSSSRESDQVEEEPITNSVSFDSDASETENSSVSLSLSAGDTDVYSDTSSTSETPAPFSSPYFVSVSGEEIPVLDEQNNESRADRVVGVGRVINVGPSSSRTSFLSHDSNHSSSFATLGGSQGSGTAIATATARTFRHVHTAVVVADGTNGGPQFALRTAINRAIAGAFAGCGEAAVASNIINTTHRLQWWDFTRVQLPDLKNSNCHVIAPSCKIHNDASCDISSDGRLLATHVPSAQGFPDDGVVAVFSLQKANFGQCVFAKKLGPNAISISLSPHNQFIMVGLAARRLHWHLTSRQMVAQVFRLSDNDSKSSDDLKPVLSIMHECEANERSHVSVNAAFFHPLVGNGLVYGTNKGHLLMRQFGRRSTRRFLVEDE